MIRLEYRNQNINSPNDNLINKVKRNYARITYNPEETIEKRWVTKTKSQAKLEKEMERRETRNIKNMILSWQTPGIRPNITTSFNMLLTNDL